VEKGAGRKAVYRREEKTHETKVSPLGKLTGEAGRFSAGLVGVDWEDTKAKCAKFSGERSCLQSTEPLNRELGRLAQKKAEDGAETILCEVSRWREHQSTNLKNERG
jgi:hypothetical protein